MKWNKKDFRSMDRLFRINLINSVTGVKPGNLIGTCSKNGISNLAIFNSVFHMGSNPPLFGMLVRPDHEVRRHTLENIRDTGQYTINHVQESMIIKSHYTSAKFAADESEFKMCGLTEEYMEGFKAPYVKESEIKIGMALRSDIPIKLNNTILVIGEIQHIFIDVECVNENGYIDLECSKSVGISGLNSYYRLLKIKDLPYARVSELPDFTAR